MKFIGKRPQQEVGMTLLAAVPLPPAPRPDPEPLTPFLAALAPLKAEERLALIGALRAEELSPQLLGDRLASVLWVRGAYHPRAEVACSFAQRRVTIEVARDAPPHVHERLADIAPFLNVAAARLTHSGRLSLCLQDLGGPGHLSFSGPSGTPLLPDSGFWAAAAYREDRGVYARAPAWEARSSQVLWRGSTTGEAEGSWRGLQRAKLCEVARDADSTLGFDVGFTSVVQLDDVAAREIEDGGLLKPWVPHQQYGLYKYHIDIDGNTNAWSSLFRKLLCGGLVFKVESPGLNLQWYYSRLQAWRHYVPVSESLDDLIERVKWARANEARAAEIAASGRRFAEGLTLAGEADVAAAVIETELARAFAGKASV